MPGVVATLGFFDGVHVGHRHLISQVKAEAGRLGLPSAVITFPVHPRKVLQADYQPKLLCGYEEKLEQLATTEVDYCISLPFTTELSRLTAREFITDVLTERIGVHTFLVGYDHRFGHNREEGVDAYLSYGNSVGMNVIQATELRVEGENVSSSRIRRLLMSGEILQANRLLSYNYTLSGKIVEGYQVGRTIGFPTANVKAWEKYKVVPLLGVYAVRVHFRGETHGGMLYIGTRPTLQNGTEISVEVNIFDFNEDLYNESLTVEFIDFIRGDEKFGSIRQLVEQIHRDKENVIERLKNG
ncbi:bifunctional riboflavin kinase/FAD synthetase [Petrimonas mucosa]|uniref:Riboflavin biosynthesis protein n=1 Tax=Petrimonas mucosa TaxID=1642646 RepID=A0A1G4G4C9_9BACT|nr:Riboflavin biosynthesis protein RibC [Petrimonas mucosa]SFU68697.1 riboflavin kinase / FMN adenylyltransferase [Porphyromonadaceae bacterium KHP3R9]